MLMMLMDLAGAAIKREPLKPVLIEVRHVPCIMYVCVCIQAIHTHIYTSTDPCPLTLTPASPPPSQKYCPDILRDRFVKVKPLRSPSTMLGEHVDDGEQKMQREGRLLLNAGPQLNRVDV